MVTVGSVIGFLAIESRQTAFNWQLLVNIFFLCMRFASLCAMVVVVGIFLLLLFYFLSFSLASSSHSLLSLQNSCSLTVSVVPVVAVERFGSEAFHYGFKVRNRLPASRSEDARPRSELEVGLRLQTTVWYVVMWCLLLVLYIDQLFIYPSNVAWSNEAEWSFLMFPCMFTILWLCMWMMLIHTVESRWYWMCDMLGGVGKIRFDEKFCLV